uniref:Uncharacterized protein n=1 Tax=Anguilla anguilla TaxID=7936 RepID=A0A0E9VQP1_ANGAN
MFSTEHSSADVTVSAGDCKKRSSRTLTFFDLEENKKHYQKV